MRIALYEAGGGEPELLEKVHDDGSAEPEESLRDFSSASAAVDAAVHRVVYGGSLGTAGIIDSRVEREIERLAPIAPLHNPLALRWIQACRRSFGDSLPQVAVFDTAFFSALPAVASTYALPLPLCRKLGLRRHGFHGIAHEAMLREWRSQHPELAGGGKLITLQLGSGCSITAISSGRAIDTSMGFTPLEGLVMASRPGDLDPGLVIYLQRHGGMNVDEIDRLLNSESGLLGISGESDDMRELLASESPGAQLAVDIYCYRVRKYIGAYLAVLGGLDGIVFGGGVGENSPAVRERILCGLSWLGLTLDRERNLALAGGDGIISASGSEVEARVVSVDENLEMARAASEILGFTNNSNT